MSDRMSRGRRCTAAVLLAACAGLASASDATNQAGVLHLRAAEVFTNQTGNMLARPGVPVDLAKPVAVIQLDGPITTDQRAQLRQAGVVFLDYIPDFAYAVDLSDADMAALTNLNFVRWAGAFDNAWKVSPELGSQPVTAPERIAMRQNGVYSMQVVLWPNANLNDTLTALSHVAGVQVQSSGWTGREMTLTATMPLTSVTAASAIEGVRWIEDTPEVDLRNATVRWIVQSNVTNDFPMYDHGITGLGQIIGVQDGRMDINHCSFLDPEGDPPGPNHRKVLAYNTSFGADLHGTHTACTVAGDAGSTNDTRGIAYDAKIVFNTYNTSGAGFLSNLNQHYSQGAAVHTNSWGNDGTTSYDSLARAIDVFSYDNDDNLVCFAVSNLSTLRNPENAKDVLAVGASFDTPSQSNRCYGGQGPTNDGRRKPEIYSPGCNIRSAFAGTSCSTTSLSGTSMACPSIAGSALLARQYYMDGFYPSGAALPSDGFTPSGALLKATLLNSTVDMTGVAGYPSNPEGWGRVLLHNTLVFDDDARELIVRDVRNGSDDAMATGDSMELQFEVTDLAQPLKVTLVWHDAPGNLNANPAYVNNLDLAVTGPSGTYLGNVFASGVSTSGGSADVKNNVEMVYLPVPPVGTYTLHVNAPAVNVGQQGYAVVISGAVAELSACVADWNHDGELNFFDVQGFLDSFSAHEAAADLNSDSEFNFFDVQAFLDAFSAGCP